jgi:putative addiction module antidote
MTTIRLTRVGNSVGAIIPKEALVRLRVEVGDTLYLTEAPDGYRITPYNPEFGVQIKEADKVMKRRRTVLRKLAH